MASDLPSIQQNSLDLKLIRVDSGSFDMGPSESAQRVSISHAFLLGATTVTQDQYRTLLNESPSSFEDADATAPVDSVPWAKAREFCAKLTENDRRSGLLDNSLEYRLPSEAEWEFACRADSRGMTSIEDSAWLASNSSGKTHTVARKAPNAWGFHDVLGNVWEWCEDWYEIDAKRAVRGGSWFNDERACKPTSRDGFMPNNAGRYIGFRIVAAKIGSLEENTIAVTKPIAVAESIYDAILANDADALRRIVSADARTVESVNEIPPPLHWSLYNNRPDMTQTLLTLGANIERRDQDNDVTALQCATIIGNLAAISILVKNNARTAGVMERAKRGLAGGYEEHGLDRESFEETTKLLRSLGVS